MAPRQGFECDRSGFTTKIRLDVNLHDLPMDTEITLVETSLYLGFDLVMADNSPCLGVFPVDRHSNHGSKKI
ncbi:hypothetical protein [uncultured Tateyamaria sp.]|uniref:hypothetical protein n=1 Tax=uncultured Tateyamaria sp. TaxID=455651 RepID=UPI0026126CF0|nr:hypothetical protein [uncultured Tateyamaria sp.]